MYNDLKLVKVQVQIPAKIVQYSYGAWKFVNDYQ